MSEEEGITTLRNIALVSILVLGLFGAPLLGRAQLTERVPRIGFNLRTAKKLALKIPPSILYRADKVIK